MKTKLNSIELSAFGIILLLIIGFSANRMVPENPKTIHSIGYELRELDWSPDGNNLVIPKKDGLTIWNLPKEKILASKIVNWDSLRPLVEWSPLGDKIIYASNDGGLQIVASTNLEIINSINETIKFGSVKWHPDGSKFAAVADKGINSNLGNVTIWNTSTLEEMQNTGIVLGSDDRHRLDWNKDGTQLVMANSAFTNKFVIWDVISESIVSEQVVSKRLNQVYWNDEPNLITVVYDDFQVVAFWDLEQEKWTQEIQIPYLYELDWCSNRDLIAISSYEGIHLWKYQQDEVFREIKVGSGSLPVACNPKFDYIAFSKYTNGARDEVRLLDLSELDSFLPKNIDKINTFVLLGSIIGVILMIYFKLKSRNT